jgi:hypothetical protein
MLRYKEGICPICEKPVVMLSDWIQLNPGVDEMPVYGCIGCASGVRQKVFGFTNRVSFDENSAGFKLTLGFPRSRVFSPEHVGQHCLFEDFVAAAMSDDQDRMSVPLQGSPENVVSLEVPDLAERMQDNFAEQDCWSRVIWRTTVWQIERAFLGSFGVPHFCEGVRDEDSNGYGGKASQWSQTHVGLAGGRTARPWSPEECYLSSSD